MFDHKFVDFIVNCPDTPFSKQKMQIVLVRENDSDPWFPLPCNGCDFYHGGVKCDNCRAALTLMFYHGVEMDLTKPVTPKMPPKVQPDV